MVCFNLFQSRVLITNKSEQQEVIFQDYYKNYNFLNERKNKAFVSCNKENL